MDWKPVDIKPDVRIVADSFQPKHSDRAIAIYNEFRELAFMSSGDGPGLLPYQVLEASFMWAGFSELERRESLISLMKVFGRGNECAVLTYSGDVVFRPDRNNQPYPETVGKGRFRLLTNMPSLLGDGYKTLVDKKCLPLAARSFPGEFYYTSGIDQTLKMARDALAGQYRQSFAAQDQAKHLELG